MTAVLATLVLILTAATIAQMHTTRVARERGSCRRKGHDWQARPNHNRCLRCGRLERVPFDQARYDRGTTL